MADVETKPSRRAMPLPLRRFLELFVLSGFAIAQPLLNVTGRSPETFVFYRVVGLQVVAFAILIVLVVPVLLWLAVSGVAILSDTAGRIAHAVVSGGLIALIVVQIGKKALDLRGPLLVAVAVVVAFGALVLFVRSQPVRTFVMYLTPAPVIFALLFLVASPAADLVRTSHGKVSATGVTSSGAKPPVVMIVLDEFPLVSLLDSKGEVDKRLFPNFARLASNSDWYRNATAVSPFTQYAVPALLSGRYPKASAAPSYIDHPNNIFSLLAPTYKIRAFETITQLCDPALCEKTEPARSDLGLRGLLGQTWRVAKGMAEPYDDSTPVSDQFAEQIAGTTKPTPKPASGSAKKGPNWKALKANQPDRFQRFLRGLHPTSAPTLHFLHLLMPHTPWRYLPSGATYPDKLLGGVHRGWGVHAWPLQVDRQRHLLQLAYTDRLLGEVIDRMEKQGIWDDALVVVTADHGESFIPGTSGRRMIERADDEAQIGWVPVFIKAPGQSVGTRSDANWEQVDLLPTMADVLGARLSFKVDGISQLSHKRSRTDKYFYNNPGDRLTFAGAPAFELVLQGATDTVVRGSSGLAGLYETGWRPDWIGKGVSSLSALGVDTDGPQSPMTARLASVLNFGDVDPSSGSVPSLVSGTLKGSAGRGRVVIAVNGTVAAVSDVWPEKGKPSFAGMVNDELFKAGANRLALYEVVGDAQPQLRPIAVR